jgi:uncharacterized protein YndB with AHSA1/START domain
MELKVDKIVELPVSQERAWRAWTEDIDRWWAGPYYNDARRVTGLRFETFVGGRFLEEWGTDGRGFLIGHVVEWFPPHRLAYTWTESRWRGVATLVGLDFESLGPERTRLHLVHTGFERLPEGERMQQGYAGGHEELMQRLKIWLEKPSPA